MKWLRRVAGDEAASGMQDFKKLRVWGAAHRLALNVEASCDARLFARRPGLRSQMVRTADSVASNISEGTGRSNTEFARYLDMSLAAADELENHLLRTRDSGLMRLRRANKLIDCTDHVRRMLIRLIQKVREDRP
jgi:four helix bundle protein